MIKIPHLPNQIQCKSSNTATADDQVIPLPKQIDHPQISLPMQKKDKPCPFIVRRGWCIKGQECDFSHANSEQPGSAQTSKDEKSTRSETLLFWGESATKQYYIPYESARNELAGNRKHPNTSRTTSPRLPPQPRYLPSRAVYPSPLMETAVYPPFYRRH